MRASARLVRLRQGSAKDGMTRWWTAKDTKGARVSKSRGEGACTTDQLDVARGAVAVVGRSLALVLLRAELNGLCVVLNGVFIVCVRDKCGPEAGC